MDWFNPAWESLSDDDRLVLEVFFLDDLSAEDAAVKVAEHFYVERKTAFARSSAPLPASRVSCSAETEALARMSVAKRDDSQGVPVACCKWLKSRFDPQTNHHGSSGGRCHERQGW